MGSTSECTGRSTGGLRGPRRSISRSDAPHCYTFSAGTAGLSTTVTASARGAAFAGGSQTFYVTGLPDITSSVACASAENPSAHVRRGLTATCTLYSRAFASGGSNPIRTIASDFVLSVSDSTVGECVQARDVGLREGDGPVCAGEGCGAVTLARGGGGIMHVHNCA